MTCLFRRGAFCYLIRMGLDLTVKFEPCFDLVKKMLLLCVQQVRVAKVVLVRVRHMLNQQELVTKCNRLLCLNFLHCSLNLKNALYQLIFFKFNLGIIIRCFYFVIVIVFEVKCALFVGCLVRGRGGLGNDLDYGFWLLSIVLGARALLLGYYECC